METFDAIVIGTGGVGSATLYELAKRGVRVLGLDPSPPGHASGSSHGQTRIIRQAYFEHPDYVPMLLRAYELWDSLEACAETKLFHPIGLLEAGPPEGVLIPGIRQSVKAHSIPVETLSPSTARAEFPFHFPDSYEIIFEPTAGYLLVEDCVKTHVQQALQWGATWRQETVRHWSQVAAGVQVRTDEQQYEADQIIVCGGAWSQQLLRPLGVRLQVLAKQQYWATPQPSIQNAPDWPTYFFETPLGYFYGFPQVTERGPKFARHSGGIPWEQPQELASFNDPEDEQLVRQFLRETIPAAAELAFTHQTCMYTLSPDEHFILGTHPDYGRVQLAAGLSGHGFKFTPVLGEILCDLALQQPVTLPIEFLSPQRF